MSKQQSLNTIDAYLQQLSLKESIKNEIDKSISNLIKENEELKEKIKSLQKQPKENEGKFSNVRQQLLMTAYQTDLQKLKENKSVEQLGAFFSAWLNRHPQRARQPFSRFQELTFSTNKPTAKIILKDLLFVQKRFEDFGEKTLAKKVQKDIDKLNQKHFN